MEQVYTKEQIDALKERVLVSLEKIRPAIQMDGGDVDLIDITPEGIAIVELTGHCQHCSLSPMTIKVGIERLVMTDVPEIRGVESV